MNTKSDAATEKFVSGYNCAQSVLWAFAGELGLDPDTALKISTGFGAGMGRRQETCGAVSGGIMVLGLKYGRGEGQERTVTEESYAKTQELMRRFEAKHGPSDCRQILGGCDLMTEEGRKTMKDRNLHDSICKPCVRTVVAILEDMLKTAPEQAKKEK